jgi:hypothetical protein
MKSIDSGAELTKDSACYGPSRLSTYLSRNTVSTKIVIRTAGVFSFILILDAIDRTDFVVLAKISFIKTKVTCFLMESTSYFSQLHEQIPIFLTSCGQALDSVQRSLRPLLVKDFQYRFIFEWNLRRFLQSLGPKT